MFLMRDDEISKLYAGEAGLFSQSHLGRIHILRPHELQTKMDWTSPPGQLSGIWYGLMFWLGKNEWFTAKSDEWLEVSPVHAQYYQLTKMQKEAIEAKIKEGLRSASQAVADYELLLHDQRKYQEFLDYFGLKYENGTFTETGKVDDHSLKTIFVDQVDFYAGGAAEGAGRLSMSFMQQRNIMPTIVQDFYEMTSEDDLDEKEHLKDLPKVEKNMLKTKWRAYQEWKKLFGGEIRNRFVRINELVKSRKTSVEQYREWLKPYIAKHKLLEEGLNKPGGMYGRKTAVSSWYHSTGHATSQDSITIWAWKTTLPYELKKYPGEEIARHPVDLCDKFVKDNIIFHPKHGLITDYPWITEAWVDAKVKEIEASEMVKSNKLYYSFVILKSDRTNLKFASGAELEDIVFTLTGLHLSNNAVMCKMLEKEAREEEMERYVNDLIGVENKVPGKAIELGEVKESAAAKIKSAFSSFGYDFQFFKSRGPFERDFNDRIVKWYLRRLATGRYIPIVNYLKKSIGYGQ